MHVPEPQDLGASLGPVVAVDRPEGAEVFVVGAGLGRVELRAALPREPARELDQLAHLAGDSEAALVTQGTGAWAGAGTCAPGKGRLSILLHAARNVCGEGTRPVKMGNTQYAWLGGDGRGKCVYI